jgi:dTDP-4-amino-4,6-dideoxygalactose transaminase
MARIYLSPPDVGDAERQMLLDAFDSGWIAPVGPDLDAFEREFAARVEVENAVAVSTGTAALHLLLHAFAISTGDVVIVSSFTFAATANAILYTGATPVFVDSELETWNLDPDLVEEAIIACRGRGQRVKAVLAVDLYGRCAQYDRLVDVCRRHDVILFEDAAEALGATGSSEEGHLRQAGGFGVAAAFSFNGNKIITTSGGGMVVSSDRALVDRIRYLSTQARQPVEHYEHTDVGFNYRMSNLLAALGRAQLMGLDRKIARRRAINGAYRSALGNLPGVSFDPVPETGTTNCWLTCLVIDPAASGGVTRQAVSALLSSLDIESRPLWKPMHLQPIFAEAGYVGRGVSDRLFETGLCLPSGSNLSDRDLDYIISSVISCWPSADVQ